MAVLQQVAAIGAMAAIALSSGCTASMLGLPSAGVVDYKAPSVSLRDRRAAIHRGVVAHTVKALLEITYEDANLGRVEAVTAIDDSFGMVTRERWIFQIEPEGKKQRLTVENFTEQRMAGGTWRRSERVSANYSYAREKNAIALIRERIGFAEIGFANVKD